ncbi:hypothetical protein Taro_013471 [Colocasia esculenta]|uniref:Homeobox domain-containing protein n=1 Tax=Colocasia esculenta TaxID=4460 RepID=A0A843UFP0_COLES|nr:hypothetical protein [Colocasia esculenta]
MHGPARLEKSLALANLIALCLDERTSESFRTKEVRMATYYPGLTDQTDVMPAIYVRERGNAPCTESSLPGSMLYLNYSSSSVYSDSLPGSSQIDHNSSDLPSSSVSALQGQGLSLSLCTQIPVPSLQFQPANSDTLFMCSHQSPTGNSLSARDEGIHVEPSPSGLSKLACPITNSKYLKAAQQLLDEFVNVQKALKHKTDKNHTSCGITKVNDGESESDEVHKNSQESTANPVPELSPIEKQGLQNKMTKLLAMLDEVDRRYKQYYHQIQIVVSSFDVVAGCGAAKPYTALALYTISQHFRCLRDAIDGQIRATSRSLGEEDLSPSSSKGVGMSRLRYIDQEIRQQRAFQQFGMMQQHAWRPQRGLPETSVSILRAWLFEHFLHPYPKDSDKLKLARQTGLTRSQVSNWFINARVRLWKPMIEEMYKDEFGGTEVDCNLENIPKGRKEISYSKDGGDLPNLESTSEGQHLDELSDSSKSGLLHVVQMDVAATGLQRELNTGEMGHMDLRLGEHRPPAEDGQLLHHVLARHDESSSYMGYQMAELGNYGNASVSLTLGLQHCHGGLPVSEGHQNYVAVGGDDMYNPASLSTNMADYDCLSLADRQQKFSSSQLLHDFVA